MLASNTVFENRETSSYLFEYSFENPEENSTTNYFIKEISKYNLSSINNTSYIFHYEVNKSIKLESPNTFVVNADMTGLKCTGDIFYKGFDISDILMPDKLDIKLVVLSEGKYITSKEFFGIPAKNGCHFQAEFNFEMLDENRNFSLKFENIRFYSDPQDQQSFNIRVNHVDDYYASIAIIDRALEEFSQIDIAGNSILEFYITLKELERTYNKVQNEVFLSTLNIKSNDVGGYQDKLQAMGNQLVRYKEYFDILIQDGERFKFSGSVSNYAEFYVKEATRYLLLSQQVTHSQSTYFYSMGKIDYDHASINQYYWDIKKVLTKSVNGKTSTGIFKQLEDAVFKFYIKEANSLIDQQQFYLALGLLQNAEKYYKTTKGIEIPVSLNILISKTNYGIFDSYLQIIDKSIEVGNYDMAETYLNKAMDFQKGNSVSIITDDYVLRITEKLAVLYIDRGNRLVDEGDYKGAVSNFEQALKLCHKIERFNYDYEIKHGLMIARNGLYKVLINQIVDELGEDNIQKAEKLLEEANQLAGDYYYEIIYSPEHVFIRSAINHYYYQNLMNEGKSFLERGDYRLAYENFLKAFELEAKSNFELSPELPELFYTAAAPVLVDMCGLGEVKVKKNQLEEAREIYNTCFKLQDDYGLIFQPKVQESLTLLNNSIFTRYCEKMNKDFEGIIASFDDLIDQGDFISAVSILDSTQVFSSQNYYCELDRDLVTELKAKYGPAAEYQQLAKVAQDALVSKNHEKFIEAHERMKFLSSNYEVIRKYIEPLPLHYLFSVKKNLALLETSVEYFKNQKEFETALDLLAVIEANNYPEKDTKSIQQKLGNRMALADKGSIYSADPGIIADGYTAGNSYLKHFKKAYIKNW